jgi:hypothetical protein
MMDIHDPVTVYTLQDPVRAELIKNHLLSEGIRSRLEGVTQGGFAGLQLTDIEVVVAAGDADRARQLIAAHEEPKEE